MKKNLLTIFALSATLVCNAAFAYELTGEGHVSEPVIVKNDPSFTVIENTGVITADPQKKSSGKAMQKQVS